MADLARSVRIRFSPLPPGSPAIPVIAIGSLNDAQVERALDLAKNGHNMSDVELRVFNRNMKFNGGEKDGQFATGFYKGLGGPEKTLEFYADITTDGTEKDATKVRLDAVKDFQQAMGPALANATDPDTKNHLPASWGDEFRRLGTQQISWMPHQMPKPYGYQVLGGLMWYGDYDPSFINPIAEHLTQLHKEDPDKLLTHVGHGQGDNYGFNPSGKPGSGEDPLNSVLEALGHSPEASEKFFTDPPTAYNEDGTVKQVAAGYGDSAEREYAVPSSLCGIHIKAATLTPLLPPGKHVAVKPDTPVPDAIRTCEVAVEKKVVLPSNASDANRERRRATSPWTNSPPTSPDPRRPARSRTRTRPPYPSPGAPPRTWSRRTSPPSSGSSNRAARMNRRSRT